MREEYEMSQKISLVEMIEAFAAANVPHQKKKKKRAMISKYLSTPRLLRF